MQTQQKIVVLRAQKSDKVPAEVPNRDFWIEQRHALLMQLASIERLLGLSHKRCRQCNSRIEENR